MEKKHSTLRRILLPLFALALCATAATASAQDRGYDNRPDIVRAPGEHEGRYDSDRDEQRPPVVVAPAERPPVVVAPPRDAGPRFAPPAPRREARGARPSRDAAWTPGYWAWSGNRFLWQGGRWEHARGGQSYVAPSWQRTDSPQQGGNYVFVPGHWERTAPSTSRRG